MQSNLPQPGRDLARERRAQFLAAAVLLLLPFVFYIPGLNGDFIWDDNVMLTANPYVQAPDGLKSIWFSTRLTDYLPLTSTSFWLEWRLWGMNPIGYRVTNLLLHGLSGILLWQLLRRLSIPGAWFAAAVFVVHPVCVASVAWITERKNTLSLLFYLIAFNCYIRAPEGGRSRLYIASLAAFALALLSKTSVVMLPVILLGLALWQKGRVTSRDIARTAPFFILSLIFGLVTVWFQFHRSLGETAADTLTLPAKAIAATWAVWFYAWKIIWPTNLVMIYPAWNVDVASAVAYVPVMGLVLVGCLCWKFRKSWGRHGLMALFYFIVTLFPVLGFFDMYFLTFARVADHWQYVALPGVIAAVTATFFAWLKPFPGGVHKVIGAGLIFCLGLLTWHQSSTYATSERLWRHTLSLNPKSWPAHNNLGRALDETGKTTQAIAHYEQALQINPRFSKAHYNLAVALEKTGRPAEAIMHFREAIRLEPKHVISMNHLGNLLAGNGKTEEAIAQYESALSIKPDFAEAHNNLANVLFTIGRSEAAIEHYKLALRYQPGYPEAHNNLAFALQKRGDVDEAIAHYESAIHLRPSYAQAHVNVATLLLSIGRLDAAKRAFEKALQLQPTPEAHYNLALILLEEKNQSEAAQHLTEALRLRPTFPEAQRELDALAASQ